MHEADTAVIGAGPYGLSIAAHLRAAGRSVVVLGRPLESWGAMPRGMMLKSPWSASSLSDPRRELTLDRYVWEERGAWPEPIPLPMFVDYCDWFRRRAVQCSQSIAGRKQRGASADDETNTNPTGWPGTCARCWRG